VTVITGPLLVIGWLVIGWLVNGWLVNGAAGSA
jgi:hypothetical protein